MPPECPINCFDSFFIVWVRTRGVTSFRGVSVQLKTDLFFAYNKKGFFFYASKDF